MGISGTVWLLYYMIFSGTLDNAASSRRIPRDYNKKSPRKGGDYCIKASSKTVGRYSFGASQLTITWLGRTTRSWRT